MHFPTTSALPGAPYSLSSMKDVPSRDPMDRTSNSMQSASPYRHPNHLNTSEKGRQNSGWGQLGRASTFGGAAFSRSRGSARSRGTNESRSGSGEFFGLPFSVAQRSVWMFWEAAECGPGSAPSIFSSEGAFVVGNSARVYNCDDTDGIVAMATEAVLAVWDAANTSAGGLLVVCSRSSQVWRAIQQALTRAGKRVLVLAAIDTLANLSHEASECSHAVLNAADLAKGTVTWLSSVRANGHMKASYSNQQQAGTIRSDQPNQSTSSSSFEGGSSSDATSEMDHTGNRRGDTKSTVSGAFKPGKSGAPTGNKGGSGPASKAQPPPPLSAQQKAQLVDLIHRKCTHAEQGLVNTRSFVSDQASSSCCIRGGALISELAMIGASLDQAKSLSLENSSVFWQMENDEPIFFKVESPVNSENDSWPLSDLLTLVQQELSEAESWAKGLFVSPRELHKHLVQCAVSVPYTDLLSVLIVYHNKYLGAASRRPVSETSAWQLLSRERAASAMRSVLASLEDDEMAPSIIVCHGRMVELCGDHPGVWLRFRDVRDIVLPLAEKHGLLQVLPSTHALVDGEQPMALPLGADGSPRRYSWVSCNCPSKEGYPTQAWLDLITELQQPDVLVSGMISSYQLAIKVCPRWKQRARLHAQLSYKVTLGRCLHMLKLLLKSSFLTTVGNCLKLTNVETPTLVWDAVKLLTAVSSQTYVQPSTSEGGSSLTFQAAADVANVGTADANKLPARDSGDGALPHWVLLSAAVYVNGPLPVSMLPSMFDAFLANKIEISQLGFTNFTDLVNSVPDHILLLDGKQNLCPGPGMRSMLETSGLLCRIPLNVQRAAAHVLLDSRERFEGSSSSPVSSEIELGLLTEAISKHLGEVFRYSDLGYRKLLHFVRAMPHLMVVRENPAGSGKWFVSPTTTIEAMLAATEEVHTSLQSQSLAVQQMSMAMGQNSFGGADDLKLVDFGLVTSASEFERGNDSQLSGFEDSCNEVEGDDCDKGNILTGAFSDSLFYGSDTSVGNGSATRVSKPSYSQYTHF